MGKLESLPSKIRSKIYKTGTTRGADDSQIYQNRVKRSSTVLIPYKEYKKDKSIQSDCKNNKFSNGYIVLIDPDDYCKNKSKLNVQYLYLGENLLVFFRTRNEWEKYGYLTNSWTPASSRKKPLGGQYVARIPATTSKDKNRGDKIYRGFEKPSKKGAGIRLYEYSSDKNVDRCRLQLEAIIWLCKDAESVMVQAGMTVEGAQERKKAKIDEAKRKGLLDREKLIKARIIDENGITVCPLCLEEISCSGFIDSLEIPEGREVPDLTVTQNNLFHIHELKYGEYNHKPYNLGWGHHYCNVVAKDTGIQVALDWMQKVLDKNRDFELQVKKNI